MSEPSIKPEPSSAELVLVVDDEASIREVVCKVLEDEGYNTLTAEDGEEALTCVNQFKPSVVFLDIWMPGWDGIETLERLKQVSPGTQVIMISGHATIANALEATKRGAFDFIEKPLDIDKLLECVGRALREGKETETGLGSGAETISPRTHPGLLSTGMQGRNIGQRTIRSSTILYGQGLHSGQKSGLVLEPLPANSGIHFAKIGGSKAVPAFVDYVESTAFATTVREGEVSAATIEHLLAALHAFRINNLLIKCNLEVPIFDGSSKEFCEQIARIGIEEQEGDSFEIAPSETLTFATESGESISIEPADELSVCYQLDYPEPVGRQVVEVELATPEDFVEKVAPARTFGFMKDIERLQRAGLAAGGRLDNFILIGPEGIVNTELRFPDELARHKILDVLGDLYLLGRPIRGRIVARMTGHSDNIGLLRLLAEHI